ncbi:MAG: GNAT family N-acetyltransferase [Clostridia bacterium]|nr:GNAT family N-acetyltransferase [Clostridia bacterium]
MGLYGDSFIIIESDGLVVTEMTESAARAISTWKYGPPYEMYDFDGDAEELDQVMNGLHFPVYDSVTFDDCDPDCIAGPLGFIAVGPAAKIKCRGADRIYRKGTSTDIAIGLKPELCGLGKGYGLRLTGAAVNFAMQEFPDDGVRLSVAKDNLRALKVYQEAGFVRKGRFKKLMRVGGRLRLKTFYVMETG